MGGENTAIQTQKGPHIPLVVVAARKTGHWIIRGWMPFSTPENIRVGIQQFVGQLDTEIEWTTYTYDLPAYLVYGNRHSGGDLEGWDWPMGIYQFPCSNPDGKGDCFNGPIKRLKEGHESMAPQFGMANA